MFPVVDADRSQDALVQQVANLNPNTIVVVNSVGPIVVEAWIDHPNGKLKLQPRILHSDLILVSAVTALVCLSFIFHLNLIILKVWSGLPGQEAVSSRLNIIIVEHRPELAARATP